jgi:hypothetical protein
MGRGPDLKPRKRRKDKPGLRRKGKPKRTAAVERRVGVHRGRKPGTKNRPKEPFETAKPIPERSVVVGFQTEDLYEKFIKFAQGRRSVWWYTVEEFIKAERTTMARVFVDTVR